MKSCLAQLMQLVSTCPRARRRPSTFVWTELDRLLRVMHLSEAPDGQLYMSSCRSNELVAKPNHRVVDDMARSVSSNGVQALSTPVPRLPPSRRTVMPGCDVLASSSSKLRRRAFDTSPQRMSAYSVRYSSACGRGDTLRAVVGPEECLNSSTGSFGCRRALR